MTTRRFLRGLLLLAIALLLIQASSYGLIGRLVAFTSHRVLGSAGVALLTIVCAVAGLWMVIPARAWKWSFGWVRRETALPSTTGAMSARRGRRQPSHFSLICKYGLLLDIPAENRPIAAVPVQVPRKTHGRLTDVESALKHLGYRQHEYAFVAAMDPNKDLEALMREALKRLRKDS